MTQLTEHDRQDGAVTVADTRTPEQHVIDAENAYQFAIYEHLRRSAADEVYRLAFLAAYAVKISAEKIPTLIRAIDYLRDNTDAGEPVAA